jgi:hypothetical protein
MIILCVTFIPKSKREAPIQKKFNLSRLDLIAKQLAKMQTNEQTYQIEKSSGTALLLTFTKECACVYF